MFSLILGHSFYAKKKLSKISILGTVHAKLERGEFSHNNHTFSRRNTCCNYGFKCVTAHKLNK